MPIFLSLRFFPLSPKFFLEISSYAQAHLRPGALVSENFFVILFGFHQIL